MTKKAYTAPQLVVYGDFKRIVQGNLGKKADGQPGHTKHCWIAETLYGVADPRTLLLRAWMTTVHAERRAGWQLVDAYSKFGKTVARVLENHHALRRAARLLFDRLVLRALDHTARIAGKRMNAR